eukprot:9069056-Karenia_brevis.AAC.1
MCIRDREFTEEQRKLADLKVDVATREKEIVEMKAKNLATQQQLAQERSTCMGLEEQVKVQKQAME